MSVESRGRLNIATCLVTGSIETTISVSVLYVPWFGRWSDPMSRMFRRSVPSHGGIVAFGRSEPWIGGGVGVGGVESAGSSVGSDVAPGDDDGVSLQSAVPFGSFEMKMQGSLSTSFASRSY